METNATALVPQKKKSIKKSTARTTSRKKTSPHPTSATLSYAQFQKLTVINQIRRALMPGARLSALVGCVLGGAVPVSTYVIIHHKLGVTANPVLWLLVAGGLFYSAPTVFHWASAAFGSKVKAIGFTLLMEGILTFVHIDLLTYLSLGILVFINTVSAACALQVRKEEATENAASGSISLLS